MAKPTIDLATLKQLALEYGEKVGFGVAVLIFMLLTYKAVSGNKPDSAKTPDSLIDGVNKAKKHISDSTYDPKDRGVEVIDYLARSKMEQVVPDHFKLPPFNTPVVEPKGKRPDPQLFAVEQLRPSAGAGSFGLRGPENGKVALLDNDDPVVPWPADVEFRGIKLAPGSKLAPRYWTLVVGLVPLQKQSGAYDVFKRAVGGFDAKRDRPNYSEYSIARSEVTANGPGEWKILDPKEVEDEHSRWADIKQLQDEVVESRYVRRGITMDLAPLIFTIASGPYVNPRWMGEAAHPPEIPLKDPVAHGPVPRPVPGDRDADGADAPENERPQPAPVVQASEPEHLLFRFLDCTVQPGKQYRYRVRLRLANPNRNVEARLLVDPQLAKARYLETDWSEPTPVTSVPTGAEMLAGPTKTGAKGETKPTIMIVKLDKARGLIAAAIEEVALGTVLNLSKRSVWAVDPVGPQLRQLRDYTFETDAMVVDIRGGKSNTDAEKSSGEPVEVLMVDKAGRLFMRSEAADARGFASNTVPEPKVTEKNDIFAPGFGTPVPGPRARVLPTSPTTPKAGAKGVRKPPVTPR